MKLFSPLVRGDPELAPGSRWQPASAKIKIPKFERVTYLLEVDRTLSKSLANCPFYRNTLTVLCKLTCCTLFVWPICAFNCNSATLCAYIHVIFFLNSGDPWSCCQNCQLHLSFISEKSGWKFSDNCFWCHWQSELEPQQLKQVLVIAKWHMFHKCFTLKTDFAMTMV